MSIYKQMASIRLVVNHDKSIFAKQPIAARVINKMRVEEFLLASFAEIALHCNDVVKLRETPLPM